MILTDRICYSTQFQKEEKRIRKDYNDYEFNIKYKTEICKNWLSGQCKFGDTCIFAHGKQEIKLNSSQKSKECKNFKSSYFCPYGEKCQFKHIQNETKRLPIFAKILLRSTLEP